ncbi:amidohydrolase family protein [Actinophytocola algeriensis]|uniref:5-methylthioadenosine/S-adenosylhomocysteine deaminase n=1 Tax=Actinophytocola algeriensis TaxID=1768010 RepID=A0A7W7VDW9_9PSEU|nr:amidohydrolase [Actinophytocola algeriensis]MBB4906646.1 5-methylthioadenosine/S-adenosylhomocysteine deaminase [Actinophytocola algeriensis]MBE1478127.1 5-methylthioadenosine/S-adenosylhomocysteine deaminase [Actinophytocola algeriensis]
MFRLRAPIVLPCDPSCAVLRDAVVDVDSSGRLGYVGPADGAPATDAPVRSLDGILLPGMINLHAHSPMTVLRGMGGDVPLMRWLREIIWPAEAKLVPSDIEAGMLLGSVEMLRNGITTSVEQYFQPDHVVRAVLATGGRMVLGPAIVDTAGWSWRAQLDEVSARIDVDGLRPHDRIEIGYGPHSAYTLSPESLTMVAEAARARDALLLIHVAESQGEDAAQRASHGSVPKLLAKIGLLGGRVLAAHSVHLSEEDIRIFADNGVAVAHCPGSNAKLASGIARVPELRAAGVPVGLGTDGPASNDDLDLWEEMRLAALVARLSAMDSAVLTAADVLLMATRGGAEALGREDIGVLAAGRWADVVHVDTSTEAFAAGLSVPDEHLLANLVWGAGARNVRDVWVGGEQVVADHEPTKVERAKVQAQAGAVTARLRRS